MKAQQHFRSPGLIYTKCCRRRALSIIKDSTNPLVHAQSLGVDTVALDQGQHTDVLTRVCELLIGTDCTVSLLQYFYPFTIHNIYFILLHIFSPFIKCSYLLVYYFTKCTTVWLMCFVCKAWKWQIKGIWIWSPSKAWVSNRHQPARTGPAKNPVWPLDYCGKCKGGHKVLQLTQTFILHQNNR